MPVLVLAAYRDVDPVPAAAAGGAAGGAGGRPRRVAASGCAASAPDEVEEYRRARRRRTGSPDLAERLYEETEGNPLFVAETVRLLAARAGVAHPGQRPRRDREAAPAPVAGAASPYSRPPRSSAVSSTSTSSAPPPDFPAPALLELLDEALAARVTRRRAGHALAAPLRPRPDPRHPLRRPVPGPTAAAPARGASRRSSGFMRPAATTSTRSPRTRLPPARTKRPSRTPGRRRSAPPPAAPRGGRPAAPAGARGAASATATTGHGASSSSSSARRRRAPATPLGEGHVLAGRRARAERSGSGVELARAAAGYGGGVVWGRAGDDHRLVPLLEEGLAALGHDDAELRIRLLSRLAGALRDEPSRTRRERAQREAVELARRSGSPALLGWALARPRARDRGPGHARRVSRARRRAPRDRARRRETWSASSPRTRSASSRT